MDQIPLLGATRKSIVKQLLQGPRTAVQVATALGIQVSAARKHLERLKALGIVHERFERAGLGRPKKFFALTDEGREMFPRRYDAVLNAVLVALVRDQGEAQAARTLRRVAAEFAGSARPQPGRGRAPLQRLVAALEDLGFEPNLTREGRECAITSHNCPILRTAKVHRELVCKGLHAEILQVGTGGADIHRGKWIVDGDPVCTHVFRTP